MDAIIEHFVTAKVCERDVTISSYRLRQKLYDYVFRTGVVDVHWIITGSWSEGNLWEVCGDEDYLFTSRDNPIIPVPGHQVAPGGMYIAPVENHPAYVRIIVTEQHLRENGNLHIPIRCKLENNLNYLDSNSFRSYMGRHMRLEGMNFTRNASGAQTHRPAITGEVIKHCDVEGMRDLVPALKGDGWPACAEEYFRRARHHNWPPQPLLEEIRQEGCHFVGKPHPHTDGAMRWKQHSRYEWAYGFSMAEKRLIQELDVSRAGCVYVLKCLKRKEWPEKDGTEKEITSYIIKTACLWVFEETRADTRMLDMVRHVLNHLENSYTRHSMSHYFIREENLLAHISPAACRSMAHTLRTIGIELPGRILQYMELPVYMLQMKRYLFAQIPRRCSKCLLGAFWNGLMRREDDAESGVKTAHCAISHKSTSSTEVIQKVTDEVAPSSRAYQEMTRYRFAINAVPWWKEVYDIYEMVPLEACESLALGIALHLEENMADTAKPSCLLETTLLDGRFWGDLFSYLYQRYAEVSAINMHMQHPTSVTAQTGAQGQHTNETAKRCLQHAERHLIKSAQLMRKGDQDVEYPDIGGSAHLAYFYYLNNQKDKCEQILRSLGLDTVMSDMSDRDVRLLVNASTPVYLLRKSPSNARLKQLWKRDAMLLHHIPDDYPDNSITVNAVCLVNYLQARLGKERNEVSALKQATHKIHQMVEASETTSKLSSIDNKLQVWDARQKRSCSLLLDVLIKIA